MDHDDSVASGELVIYANESRVAVFVCSRVLPTANTRLKECGHGRAFLAGEFVEYTTIIDATGQKCHVQCCYTAQCLKWLPSCRIYIPSLCFSSVQPPCVLSTRSSRPVHVLFSYSPLLLLDLVDFPPSPLFVSTCVRSSHSFP